MIDYLTDDVTGDLVIKNGDFARGRSEQKNAAVIIKSPAGYARRYPMFGVGAIDYKNALASKLPALAREISLQLDAAGFVQPNVKINTDNKLEINV